MVERRLVGKDLNISVQTPVLPGQPFRIAERTARRVDPFGMMRGIQAVGLLSDIASARESRQLSKIRRKELEKQIARDDAMRGLFGSAIRYDPATNVVDIDRGLLIGGLAQLGEGGAALQMQQDFQAQDLIRFEKRTNTLGREMESILRLPAARRQEVWNQRRPLLEQALGVDVDDIWDDQQARDAIALSPESRALAFRGVKDQATLEKLRSEIALNRAKAQGAGLQTLEERAAAGSPIAQKAVTEREKRRQASRLETQRQLVDIMAGRESARAREQRRFAGELTVAEGMPDVADRIFDTQTGELINQGQSTKGVRQQIQRGQARVLSPKQAGALQNAQGAIEPVRRLRELMLEIYGPGGTFDNLQSEGRIRAGVRGALARAFQTDEDLVEANRVIQANVDSIRRAFQGQVGTQTEQDARRGIRSLPNISGLPDTKEVAYRNLNNVMRIVNRIFKTHLSNKRFELEGLQPLQLGTSRARTQAQPSTQEGRDFSSLLGTQ